MHAAPGRRDGFKGLFSKRIVFSEEETIPVKAPFLKRVAPSGMGNLLAHNYKYVMNLHMSRAKVLVK
jgi:hypothetical protein